MAHKLMIKTKLIVFLILTSSFLLDSYAGSATWNLNPATAEWDTATNWTPATVPNGQRDIATFDVSTTTTVTISTDKSLGAIVFNPGASAFIINPKAPDNVTPRFHDIYGAGITNNSGITQNFVNYNFDLLLYFHNSSTAGDLVTFTWYAGGIDFEDTANAGQATINVNSNFTELDFHDFSSAANSTIFDNVGGGLDFWESSTADHATVVNGGTTVGLGFAGHSIFRNSSHAAYANVICLGTNIANAQAGYSQFVDTSSADNASLSASGGTVTGGVISFLNGSSGGTASVELSDNAILSVSLHDAPGVAIGSLDGSGGTVLLGANNLTVGGNDKDMRFEGVISDDGVAGGSITKIGRGQLILSAANDYLGGTVVNEGELVVTNTKDSATGSGPVQVLGGALGGRGVVAGDITVGSGGKLAPSAGSQRRTVLRTFGALTFAANATLSCRFYIRTATADAIVANGVTIEAGALFSVPAGGNPTLVPGTIFTVIKNNSAAPIAGTFANLADGGTIIIGGNTFQANYEGGDGNDLTLTVL